MIARHSKKVIAALTALTIATAFVPSVSQAGEMFHMGGMGMHHMGGMGDEGFGGMGAGFAAGFGMVLIGEAIAQHQNRVIWSGSMSGNGHTETAVGYDAGMDFSKRPGKRQKVRVVRTRDGKPLTRGGSWGSTTDPETGVTTTSSSNGDGSRTVTQTSGDGKVISSQVVR
jgi:hypothetical protein